MAEKADLSLDDIIKLNKKNAASQRGGNKTNKPNLQRIRNLGARSGIVRKGGPRTTSKQQHTQPSPRKEATMLHVSNLHFEVSNKDVRELFMDIGPIKKAAVHYDKVGRSLGTAEVIFQSREDAIRAIKKYHQLPLDGRPMSITLVPNQSSVIRSPAKSRIGVKPGSGIHKRTQVKNQKSGSTTKGRPTSTRGPKGRFQGRSQRQPKKQVTAEQLDADLEEFTKMQE